MRSSAPNTPSFRFKRLAYRAISRNAKIARVDGAFSNAALKRVHRDGLVSRTAFALDIDIFKCS